MEDQLEWWFNESRLASRSVDGAKRITFLMYVRNNGKQILSLWRWEFKKIYSIDNDRKRLPANASSNNPPEGIRVMWGENLRVSWQGEWKPRLRMCWFRAISTSTNCRPRWWMKSQLAPHTFLQGGRAKENFQTLRKFLTLQSYGSERKSIFDQVHVCCHVERGAPIESC